MFIDFLSSMFSPEERSTELYKLLAQCGTYNELALAQELRALVDLNVDPGYMDSDKLRKFLSFFYVPVRNYIPASGTIHVRILEARGSVAFSDGQTLPAPGGGVFRCTSGGVGSQGQTVDLTISQYEENTAQGTYQDYITIDASNVWLDSLSVSLAGKAIPAVKSPYNGFMSFFFSGKVYIKIFPGPDIPSVRGQAYSVGYATTYGASGNAPANSISSFMFPINDTTLNPIKYELSHDAIENGASAPLIGELRDLLRYWMYVRNVLTKPSDYRYWFLTQPEVGDCLVWGDTEDYLMNGTLTITGQIRICLLSAEAAVIPTATRNVLNARVQQYKDVGYLTYVDPTFIRHYFDVRFLGASDEAQFVSQTAALIEGLYDLDTQRSQNASLFDAVDVGALVAKLSALSSAPRGLEVIPYYYIENTLTAGSTTYTAAFSSPRNLKRGYSKFTMEVLNEGTGAIISSETFTELMTSADIASIVRSNGVQVGTHNYATNTVSITAPGGTFAYGRMKAFGEAANRSYLDTGAFTRARLLGGYTFTKVTAQY